MTTAEFPSFDFKGSSRQNGPARPKPPLGKLFDMLPPSSPEAEMSLLGSMILDPTVIADVLPVLGGPQDFYLEKHAEIYKALVETYDKHNSGDLVQLNEVLRDRGLLDALGGGDYLVQLSESVPSAVNAPHYARIVAEKGRLRRLIEAAGQILYDAYHFADVSADGAREVVDRAEALIFEIAQKSDKSDPQTLAHLLQAEIERIEASDGKGYSGLPTGYVDLDDKLRGLQPGELIILAARPSMGKTALALNIAEQVAVGGGFDLNGNPRSPQPILVFSMEMSKSSVTQRLLSANSGVNMQHLRSGQRISDRDYKRLMVSCDELSKAPIYIDDTPNMSVMMLRTRARRMVAQHGVKALVIDYLQLMSAPGNARDGRQNEVSAISRGVKALARELNVPVVCLSQLNRASEQREGNRPRMSDLRESGSIEQDADVIILLHREEYYHTQSPDWADQNPDRVGIAELIIAKQRNGPTGVVELKWDTAITRFRSLAAFDANPTGYSAPSAAAANFPAPARPATPKPAAPRPAPESSKPAPFDDPVPPPRGFSPGKKTGPLDASNPAWRDGGGPDDDDLGGLPT
jgi:replicative DNA helicase